MKPITVRNLFAAVVSFSWVFASVFAYAGGGLALNFYDNTCPDVYIEVENVVRDYISKAPSLAAPLLRMHFHDCFVRVSIESLSLHHPCYLYLCTYY